MHSMATKRPRTASPPTFATDVVQQDLGGGGGSSSSMKPHWEKVTGQTKGKEPQELRLLRYPIDDARLLETTPDAIFPSNIPDASHPRDEGASGRDIAMSHTFDGVALWQKHGH